MKSEIVLKQIIKNHNEIEYDYFMSDDLKDYFNMCPYKIAYYLDDEPIDISSVPNGILSIPFVCNVLPITWMNNSELHINEIDQDFFESISNFKKGYMDMYPDINLKGKLMIDYVLKSNNKGERGGTLYSGGVDANCTLINNIDNVDYLISIWGSDIPYQDKKAWNTLNDTLKKQAKNFKLPLIVIRSSFRNVIKEEKLTEKYWKMLKDNWWHGMQHGIALLGHTAPCNYLFGISRQYIAASYSPDIRVTCASCPEIDGNVKFCGCRVFHDSFIPRQDKIKLITEYSKKNDMKVPLHVCWKTITGKNCCKCEKCLRTIMGLLVEEADLEMFGFELKEEELKKCVYYCRNRIIYDNSSIPFWNQIKQKAIRNRKTLMIGDKYEYVKWMEKFDFENNSYYLPRMCLMFIEQAKRIAQKILALFK